MIYVTENGVSEKMQCTDLCDDWRMKYFKDYINEMLKGDFTVCFIFESLRVERSIKHVFLHVFFVWFDSQRWRTEWMWRDTQPGLSSTTSSGMKDSPRGSDSTTWTSGAKINRATRRPRSSSINASSALTASPTRERWTLTTTSTLKSSLQLNVYMLTFRLIVSGGELEEESCGDLLLQ